MNKKNNREHDIIHKIFDGDAGDEEKKIITRDMEADPGLREEFTGLEKAVRMLETSERLEAPPAFTGEVMKRLPRRSPSLLDRIRDFLPESRVLRWNMAALATAVIVLVTIVTVSQMRREPKPVEPTMTALSEQQGPAAGKLAGGEPVIAEAPITVRLTFHAPEAHSVAVAGKFNKWRTDDEMKKIDGKWSIDLKLKPGVYAYSFLVDGKTWVPDPGAESYEEDGFGSQNAVLRVNA